MNKMLIFTAPSGAGKTTIVRYLLDRFSDDLAFSVSATSRLPREYEEDGKDYHFLSVEDFKVKVANGDFLEWQEVYPGKFYGTLRSEVDRLWAAGKVVVFDIEVKGAWNIKQLYLDNSLAVFVRPPSLEVLLRRLLGRKTESARSMENRMERAKLELEYEDRFDTWLLNDVKKIALIEAVSLVDAYLIIGEV